MWLQSIEQWIATTPTNLDTSKLLQHIETTFQSEPWVIASTEPDYQQDEPARKETSTVSESSDGIEADADDSSKMVTDAVDAISTEKETLIQPSGADRKVVNPPHGSGRTLVNATAILEAISSIAQHYPKNTQKLPKINSLPKRANSVCRKGKFVEKQSLGKYSSGFAQHAYSQTHINMTFRSDKSENCYIKDHKGFSKENHYNKTSTVRGSNSEVIASDDVAVVVPFDDLIYPKRFTPAM